VTLNQLKGAMDEFQKWATNRHEYAREWKKKTGGKVVGYLCTYAPEELFYAAGVLPVRIFGGHEADISIVEPHIHGMYCPFCRGCLAEGLKGRYEYVDGIVIGQSCLHMRQVFFSWQRHIPHEFEHYIYVPHSNQSSGRYEYLRAELVKVKEGLEKWLGRPITDEDLDRGIKICNESRRLLRQIWEFRKIDNPPLTGSEAMDIIISCQVTDKREHNEALAKLLKELPERKLDRETGTRLMIVGSEDDDREFTRMVEEEMNMPATFVVEEHCVGTRYFWNEVVPEEDRLMAIAKRYMDRPSCPSKDWPERTRIPHILQLAKDYNVQAAVIMQEKFCDPQEFDIPTVTKVLNENGIPTYFLEFDVTVPIGQFRTRMEAFLETMIDLI
jgi:benzoyl-CoA reductase subunit C